MLQFSYNYTIWLKCFSMCWQKINIYSLLSYLEKMATKNLKSLNELVTKSGLVYGLNLVEIALQVNTCSLLVKGFLSIMWRVNNPLICYYPRKNIEKNHFVKRNRWKNGQEPCDMPYASNWSRQEMWAGVMLGHWLQGCCGHMKWGWRWSAWVKEANCLPVFFLISMIFLCVGSMWVCNVFLFEMNTMLGDELLRIKLVLCLNVVCKDLL